MADALDELGKLPERNPFPVTTPNHWCKKVGAVPYLALNMGTTLEDGYSRMVAFP
jgi:alpha-L-arabinofuranosidase